MSQNLRNFTRAVYTLDAVVQRVPLNSWDVDSPCEGWSARDVLRHQCGVLDALAQIAHTGVLVSPVMATEADDPVERWTQTRDGLLAALDKPGVLSQEGKYWFGPMSVDDLVGMVQWDPLTHAWDIGSVTGVDPHIPSDLAEQSLERVAGIEDNARKWGLIADAVPVPDAAPVTDRFLGFIGRRP